MAETSRRRALIVAYHFPPIGGPSYLRPLRFAELLPDYGWDVTVITGPGRSHDLWTPEDRSMLEEVPASARVERLMTARPPVPTGLARLIARLAARPNAFDRWWIEGVVDLGTKVGRSGGVDVILGELVPYQTSTAVMQLARDLDRPWIADLHDPWALDEMWIYPSGLHRRLDRSRMRRVIDGASATVLTTSEAVRRVRLSFPELRDRLVVSIPFGFDPHDFESPPPARDPERFRIVHTGTMHTDVARLLSGQRLRRRLLGGMPVPGVDFSTRSHVFLLQAIDRLLAEDPALSSVIELHLAGVITDADREAHATSPVVVEHGYVSHEHSIRLLRSADLLFLPMQDLPSGTRAGLVPAKTYEYIASGTPILAAVPDGDARDLLDEVGNATICGPRDVESMTRALRDHLARWRTGQPARNPSADVVERYTRRREVEAMARLLDQVAR